MAGAYSLTSISGSDGATVGAIWPCPLSDYSGLMESVRAEDNLTRQEMVWRPRK